MRQIIEKKVASMSDELLQEFIDHAEEIHNWRNWGDNELRIFAAEAFKRGLIE